MENSNWKTVHAFSLIGCSLYLLMNATVPQVHDFMYSLSESVAKQLEDCTNIFKILVQIVIGTDSVITRTDIKLISVLVITLSVIKWQYDDVIMASTSVKNEAQKKSRWDMTNSDNKGSTSAASGCSSSTQHERLASKISVNEDVSGTETKLAFPIKIWPLDESLKQSKEKQLRKSEVESGSKRLSQVPCKDSETRGVSMKLAAKNKEDTDIVAPKKARLAAVFNEDSESGEEEMPVECRMKMRNKGRETPTSAGPKSFNKTKMGFVNSHKQFELSMKPRTHLEKQTKLDDV